ncbi:hypothetical protein ACFY19_13350 [Streptosporangium saharense]|uniref:Molybdopterin converting factor small subunit n=1 Tax=Streptosporangium saharense TaxID=1706840 RepID=A0A7W7VS15_9ACTN|nr:hypothetical protein [Streptosporangium saharense]MBB4920731.1 molybdopterin converting factor small subunit [Streptosporangium saharense]
MRLLYRLLRKLPRRSGLGSAHPWKDGESGPITSVRRFFQPPPAPHAVYDEQGLHEWDSPLELVVPARGDAFSFQAVVTVAWCVTSGDGRTTTGLRADIAAERPKIHERAEEVVRRVARRFDPHLPGEAEEEVNKELTTEFARPSHQCDDVTITVTVKAQINLTEEVRELRKHLGRALLEIQAKREIDMAIMDNMTRSRDDWREFLKEGMEDWAARFAVQLAESPRGVAGVMTTMVEERRQDAQNFLDIVKQVVAAQQSVDVFDLVAASDGVLRIALERLGVPVPPPVADLPWLEER